MSGGGSGVGGEITLPIPGALFTFLAVHTRVRAMSYLNYVDETLHGTYVLLQ